MKFIDEFDIELVNQALNFETNDCLIEGGCDLFTTKPVGADRKLYKTIDKHLDQLLEENELSKSFERKYALSISPDQNSGQSQHRWYNRDRRASCSTMGNRPKPIFQNKFNRSHSHSTTSHPTIEADPYMSPKSLELNNTMECSIIYNSTSNHSTNNIQVVEENHTRNDSEDAIIEEDDTPIDESPFGPLKETASRRTFAYLITILNATYPDHDFTDLQPSDFRKTTSQQIMSKFNNTLIALGQPPKEWIWSTIDGHMDIEESKIYSFTPSESFLEDEPGILWKLSFFIFNKKRKRVAFVYLNAFRNKNSNIRTDLASQDNSDEIIIDNENEYDLTYSDDEMRDDVDIVGDLELE